MTKCNAGSWLQFLLRPLYRHTSYFLGPLCRGCVGTIPDCVPNVVLQVTRTWSGITEKCVEALGGGGDCN